MSMYFQLLTTGAEVKECTLNFLGAQIKKTENWNSNREAFICAILYQYILTRLDDGIDASMIDQWFSLTCIHKSEFRENVSICKEIFPHIKLNAAKCRYIRYVISLVLLMLSAKKQIKPKREVNLVIAPDFEKSGLLQSLPVISKLFFFISTPKNYESAASLGLLPPEVDAYISRHIANLSTQYKTWAGCSATFRRYIFHENISSFDELSEKSLANYLDTDRTRSFSFFIGLVEHVSGKTLSSFNQKTTHRERTEFEGTDEGFKCYSSADSKSMCGFENHLVFKREAIKPKMMIGDWSAFRDDLPNYNPNSLITRSENYWITTQLDYLGSQRFELGTLKQKLFRLSLLNMYLFSYLPKFFENRTLPYPYPAEIRDFHSFIYISRSLTLARHLFGQSPDARGTLPYPVSLTDFISLFRKDEDSEVSDGSNNTIRDDLREVSRYFDYVIAKYSAIEECKLSANPISQFDRPEGGSAIGKSKKVKFDYEYWLLFIEYLHAVSSTLIENAKSFTELPGLNISVKKKIPFAGMHLIIDEVKIPFKKKVTMRSPEGKSVQITPYQQFCALSFMASGGLRLANVMWLDARTFDKNVIPSKNELDIVEVFVNTDKSKDNPFEGAVQYRTMKLAQSCSALRKYFKNIPQDPIAYEGNEKSKHGFIPPVFQFNLSNNFDHILDKLPKILEGFEQCLSNSKIKFESQVVVCPTHATLLELKIARSNGDCIDSPYFTAESHSGVKSPFTPIRLKSLITVHSLRKTFDSFWAVLTNPELIGKMFTGQTEAVVGYYTENTPEEELSIKAIAKLLDIPDSPMGKILSVNLFQRTEAYYIASMRKNGLLHEGGFTLGGLHSIKDLEELFAVTPDDKISIHRTHICIYGDECPKHVLVVIKGKNCAICFISISSKRDGPAIAAKIKYLLDRVIECNELLDSGKLNAAEHAEQLNLRNALTVEVSGWIARHDHIRKMLDENDMIVMSEGKDEITKRLKYVEPGSLAHHLFHRLEEVQNVPSMQSARLKRMADRISRGLLPLLRKGNVSVPDLPPVEGALFLIEKIAKLYKLNASEISNLLEDLNVDSLDHNLIPALNLI